MILRPNACLLLAVCLILPGCSTWIRSAVDTQPRVRIDADAYAHPDEIVHGPAQVYEPHLSPAGGDWDLLNRFAPLIVQGRQSPGGSQRYSPAADEIGAPTLSRDQARVIVNTDQPAVFARTEHCRVRGVDLTQLVYVFWYPERPVGKIEQGSVDGGILRITLDRSGRPAVFEYSQPCGCFHGVFVAAHIEAAAAAEFQRIEADRLYAVEPPINGHADWVVRGLVDASSAGRPAMYMSAGAHFCEAIRIVPSASSIGANSVRPYDLRAYDDLHSIPVLGGGTGSMFNEAGLVHGAKRWKEELLLSDLDNPGWPRHLDFMLIHWDQDRWTDPGLIASRLRIPASAVDPLSTTWTAPQDVAREGRDSDRAPTPLPTSGAVDIGMRGTVVFVTNHHCLGCEEVLQHVIPDPRVEVALQGWRFQTVDAATPEGAAMAARLHVSLTPVIIRLDRDGREMGRVEGVETVEDVVAAIVGESRTVTHVPDPR